MVGAPLESCSGGGVLDKKIKSLIAMGASLAAGCDS